MTASRTLASSLALGLSIATVIADGNVRAADINDLRSFYEGSVHHNSSPDLEAGAFGLDINTKAQNGKFTGVFEGVPIAGKVTPAGKVTFSGQLRSGEALTKIKSGKAQLSATGRFITGSFKLQTNVNLDSNGSWTFHAEED